MILLIDMDGVLVDFVGGVIKEYERKTGTVLEYPTEFRFEDAWKGVADMDAINDIMLQKDFFLNLEPMPGAIEACRMMEKMPSIDFHLCTAPKRGSTYCVGEKWEWIKHYLGQNWTDNFAAIYDKTLVHGDILLDDHPDQRGRMTPEWVQVLYDHPYNRDGLASRMPRITWDNWPDMFLQVPLSGD